LNNRFCLAYISPIRPVDRSRERFHGITSIEHFRELVIPAYGYSRNDNRNIEIFKLCFEKDMSFTSANLSK
jgi:hypothetical protein